MNVRETLRGTRDIRKCLTFVFLKIILYGGNNTETEKTSEGHGNS
jgi:hypothetical protein